MSRKRKSPAKGPAPQGVIPKESQARSDSITNRYPCQERRRRRTNIEKPAYWAVLPARVRYDPEIPASAKLLYAEISALTDQTGYCFASNAYFEELYELSTETITRLLRVLEKHGYIRREDASGGKNQRRIYAGINPAAGSPADPPSKMTIPPVKNDGGPPSKMTPVSVKGNKKSTKNPPKPPRGRRRWKEACEHEPELFERFWKKYPRKDGKGEARYEWDDLKPDRELMMEMSAALRAQKATDEWQRGIGIPWACRWIRYRRWENEGIVLEESEEDPEDGEDLPEWTS